MNKIKKRIKANHVIFEAPVQVVKVNLETLNTPAVELLEPVLSVSFDREIVLPGKVILQGTIRKNILYKAADSFVRHQTEFVDFTKAVEVPGLSDGIVVNGRFIPGVGVDIEEFVTTLRAVQFLTTPTTVEEKLVLDFILKVAVLKQFDICVDPPTPAFECRNVEKCKLRSTPFC